MPKIVLKVRYPEKLLTKIALFSYYAHLAAEKRFPSGKKAGKFENKMFRVIFRFLNKSSFFLFLLLNKICKIVFKIDWIEDVSQQ